MKKFLSVLLSVMMVLSSVSFAAPTAMMTADSAVTPNLSAFVPEAEAVLAVEDTWYDLEKGTLLFNMDFDADNGGNAVASSAYDGISLGSYSAGAGELVSGLGRINPDVGGSYDIGFRYTTSGSATLVDENGNKYLSLTSSASNQISLYLGNTYTKTGKYVFEYSYKLDSTGATTASNITYNTLIPTEGGADAFIFDEWVTETATFDVTSVPAYSRVMFYAAGNYSASDKLYLDDIKVWYYDESVDYEDKCNPDIETNDVWDDDEKGTKLFTIDFTAKNDKKALNSSSWDTLLNRLDNNPATGELISDIGRINPDVDGSNYRISFNYIDNSKTELVKEGDNTYLAVASDATHGDISLYLGGFYGDEGTYTIETSYKFVQTGANSVDRIRYETFGYEYVSSEYLSTGNWVDLSEVHEHSSCSHGNVNRTRFTTEGYNNEPFAANDRIYIDNISVYFKAPVVDEPQDPEDVDDVWYDLTKGTLLFNMDFDTDNSGNAVTADAIANVTQADGGFYTDRAAPVSGLGRLNPDVTANAYTLGFRYVTQSLKALETEGGNQYLALYGNNSNNISFYLGRPFQQSGKYVLEFKYKYAPTTDSSLYYIECHTPSNTAVTDVATGEWKTFSSEYNVTGSNDVRLRFLPVSGNITSTDALLFDDIKVWYFDPDADYEELTKPDGGEDDGEDEETNEWIDNELGERLFVIDLDGDTKYQTAELSKLTNRIDGANDNSDANGLYLSEIGRVNPDYEAEYAGVFKYSFKDGGTPSVSGDADKYFTHTASTGPSVMVANPFVGEGTYTLVFNHDSAKSFTAHSGYTGGEIVATTLDSAWSQTAYSVDISAQGSDDYFRIIGSNGAGTYLVDDIALYYRSPDFVPPSDGGDDEEEDSEWKDAEKGTLLYEVDFETKNDGSALTYSDYNLITNGRLDSAPDTAGVAVSAIGRVNPEYSNNFRLNFKDAGTSTLEGTDNKYIVQTVGTAMSVFASNTFVDAGVYTFEFDYNTKSGTEFYAHSGYTSGTYSSEVIDDTWTRVTYVVEAYDATYMRFLSRAASSEGKFMYDNFKVYFRQTTKDVTVKANGNENVSDTVVAVDAENGATIGTILSNVDISASTKKLLGASLTADGSTLSADYVVKPSEVTTLYLIWGEDIVVDEEPWWEDGLGTLLFNVNWDGALSNNAQTRWADVRAGGASTNPDWKNFEKLYFMWGEEDIGATTWVPAKSSLIVAEANGNRYYTQPHAGTYNSWSLYSTFDGDWAGWADGDGLFTVSYKVKTVGNITPNNLFVDTNLVYNHATTRQDIRHVYSALPDSNGWLTVTLQFDTSEYTANVGETLGQLIFYVQTNESSAVNGAYICYDDIQVYYKPSKVNVTMKPGTNLEVNETVVEVSTKGILVSDLIALVNTEDTMLLATGIATEDGNTKYALTDTVVLDKDSTFYITWESNEWMDNELGMLIQKADFEGEMQTTSINRWPAATALGATINPEYSFDGVTGLQFTTSETGIVLDENYMWIPADYDVTENGNTYFEVPTANIAYGSSQQLTCLSMYAMGKGATQYQYQGAGTYTITGKVKYGSDISNATFEVRPNQYNGDGGLVGGFNYPIKDFKAGEWNEFSVTWSTGANDAYGLGSVQMYLFYDNLASASTIAYDDIMLYYKPFTAEITLRANNNPVANDIVLADMPTTGFTVDELLSHIRTPLGGMDLVGLAYDKAGTKMLEGTVVIGGDMRFFMIWEESELDPNSPISVNECSIRTDDPIGLRFKARIDKPVHTKSERIGWIITRYDMLEAKDINPYDFYMDTDVTMVSAYNKDTDGTNKIYSSNDTDTFVTAVLYNIPEKHYGTTLVARPFTVVDGITYYGFPIEKSLLEIAVEIRDDEYFGCTNDQMVYIMSILEACGETTEPQVKQEIE